MSSLSTLLLPRKKGRKFPLFAHHFPTRVTIHIPSLGAVLEGDLGFLKKAFLWAQTPQGFSHWERLSNGEGTLTLTDLRFLRELYSNSKPITFYP